MWTFGEQVRGLLEGGVDLLCIETCQDTRNVKAALIATERAFADAGVRRPVVVSGTIETSGTMLGGQAADAFLASIEHADLLAVGLNCATGPDLMTDHVRTIHQRSRWAVSCFPNAGLPDQDGRYSETPESLAAALARFADAGWLNIVGGCCGTTDAHTAALARMVVGRRPRPLDIDPPRRAVFTGIDLVEPDDTTRPLLVGERTNVIGSKKFREMVAAQQWDDAVEIARRQVKGGAQILDVCLQSTESDEVAAIHELFDRLGRAVKAPIMIDSTDPGAVEVALTYCQGKSIVNSINLEDGEERIEAVAPLLRRYGAAVIFGAIDEDPEQAQAFTRERKLEIAGRAHRLLTGKYGVPETDIVFDPLVFPAASGDESYIGGAVETIEGLAADQGGLPRLHHRARDLQRLLRAAGARPRDRQLGLSLPVHQGRARPGDRQQRTARALRRDPGGGAADGRGVARQHPAGRRRRLRPGPGRRCLATGASRAPSSAPPSTASTSRA